MKRFYLNTIPQRVLLRRMPPLTSDSYRRVMLSAASALGIIGT